MNRNDLFRAMEFVDDKTIEKSEVNKTVKYYGKFTKRTLLLAAVLCLLIAFATVAVATGWFGLRAALVESYDPEIKSEVSLSGLADSNEYLAAAEWKAFAAGYDPDGSLLAQSDPAGPEEAVLDAKYDHYPVYTKEMADKLDEIAAKYGLKLYGAYIPEALPPYLEKLVVNDRAEFSDAASNTVLNGYLFDCGTFSFDGIFDAAYGRLSVDYQFRCSVKGVFDATFLNIGDIETYREETFTTDSGVTFAAAVSGEHSVLITEFNSCYVFINVMGGSDLGITFDDLKDLANTFDYHAIEK